MVCGSYFCLRNLLWCVDSWLRFLRLDLGTAFQCNRLFCRGTSSLIVEDSMADRMKYAWNFQNLGEQWNRRQTVRNIARRQPHRCLFQIRFLRFWNIVVLRRDRTKFNKVSLIFTVFSVIWIRCVIKSKSQKWRDSHAQRPWCMKLFAVILENHTCYQVLQIFWWKRNIVQKPKLVKTESRQGSHIIIVAVA